MRDYQTRFLELALECGALGFGEFTLKSGRLSPYFFNAGRFNRGAALLALGACYADAAMAAGPGFDMLFGPAYKGIALATAMGTALAQAHDCDVGIAFNRKEAKDHGEGGTIIGARLEGRVLIVDDTISAGTSVRESAALISAAGARVAGVIVALDRQERGQSALSAADEARGALGAPVIAICNLDQLIDFLGQRAEFAAERPRLEAYRARYGVAVDAPVGGR